MITCRVYHDGSLKVEKPFDARTIDEARASDQRVWIDVVDPTDDELTELQAKLGLHELAIEDSRRWDQRAKVDFYPQHLFLVAHGIDLDEQGEIVDREVHLFAGGGLYVATVRREPRFDFGKVGTRLESAPDLSKEGIGFLLYLMLDEIVDGYLDVIELFEDLADDIEDDVATEEEGAEGETTALARPADLPAAPAGRAVPAARVADARGRRPAARDADAGDAAAHPVLPRRDGSHHPDDGAHRQRAGPAHLGAGAAAGPGGQPAERRDEAAHRVGRDRS